MDTRVEDAPLEVRSSYSLDFRRVLYDIYVRCRAEHRGPSSKFFVNEMLGTIAPQAHRFFDDRGDTVQGALTPKINQANLKHYQRYHNGKGASKNLMMNQLVHAYLQLKAAPKLAKVQPFRSTEQIAAQLYDYLGDTESNVDASTLVADRNKILAAFACSDTYAGETEGYLIILPGAKGYKICLYLKKQVSSNVTKDEGLQLKHGFCIVKKHWPLVVVRTLQEGNSFIAIADRYPEKAIEMAEKIYFRTHDMLEASRE